MGNAYTYYSFEEYGRGYIGARSKSCIGDDEYKGSYKDKTFNPTHKIILGEYETMEEALADEIALHNFFSVSTNPHFANRAQQTSTGFNRAGVRDTAATVERKSQSHLGKKHSPVTKKRMGIAQKARTDWAPLTYEHKQNISKATCGSTKTSQHKNLIARSNCVTKRQHWRRDVWKAVEQALSKAGSKYLWGKQAILDEYDVSERTLRRMHKLILSGTTYDQAISGKGNTVSG